MLKYIVICFLLINTIACNPKKTNDIEEEIFLPRHLNSVGIKESVKFDTNWYNNQNKVVVFIRRAGSYSTLDLDWQSAISKYPEVAFLFFISEVDSTKLLEHLKEIEFSHPVIHDPNMEFRKLNVKENEVTFISFLVRNNKKIEMSNPSLPDFHDRLDALIEDTDVK